MIVQTATPAPSVPLMLTLEHAPEFRTSWMHECADSCQYCRLPETD